MSVNQEVGRRNTEQNRGCGHIGERSLGILCLSPDFQKLLGEPHAQESLRPQLGIVWVYAALMWPNEYCTSVGGPLPLEPQWVVLSEAQMLEIQYRVQRGYIYGRLAACWHVPYHLIVLSVQGVDLP